MCFMTPALTLTLTLNQLANKPQQPAHKVLLYAACSWTYTVVCVRNEPVQINLWTSDVTTWSWVNLATSEGKEKMLGTHCLRMRLIENSVATVIASVPIDVINLPRCCASQCSVWVGFISRCSMPSGSWVPKIKPKKEQIASNECVYWGNVPLCS